MTNRKASSANPCRSIARHQAPSQWPLRPSQTMTRPRRDSTCAESMVFYGYEATIHGLAMSGVRAMFLCSLASKTRPNK